MNFCFLIMIHNNMLLLYLKNLTTQNVKFIRWCVGILFKISKKFLYVNNVPVKFYFNPCKTNIACFIPNSLPSFYFFFVWIICLFSYQHLFIYLFIFLGEGVGGAGEFWGRGSERGSNSICGVTRERHLPLCSSLILLRIIFVIK